MEKSSLPELHYERIPFFRGLWLRTLALSLQVGSFGSIFKGNRKNLPKPTFKMTKHHLALLWLRDYSRHNQQDLLPKASFQIYKALQGLFTSTILLLWIWPHEMEARVTSGIQGIQYRVEFYMQYKP